MYALPAAVLIPATPAIQATDISAYYEFEKDAVIGKGGFSEVVRARHIATGEWRALKIIQKSFLNGKKAVMVAHEKEILRRTNHPCIITLHETIQTHNHVFFALDLMSEDLFELIVRNKFVKEELSRKIMFQLLSGINYLHQQSIAHRDVKPENILINTYLREPATVSPPPKNINDVDPQLVDFVVKLADFGLSKLVLEFDVRNTPCGTSYYLAPEIIRGIEEQGARPLCTNRHVVKSIDVWSCGVVFYVLLSGRPPFSTKAMKTSEERQELLQRIDRGVLFRANSSWDEVSDEAKELICLMLDPDSTTRITASNALAHPFFTAHGFTEPIPSPSRPLLSEAAARGQGKEKDQPNSTLLRSQPRNERADKVPPPPPSVDEKESASSQPLRSSNSNKKKSGNEGGGGVLKALKSIFTSKTPEAQRMQDEISALQKGRLEAEDVEGEQSTYTSSMHIQYNKPSKPAVMNSKFKVGPTALKK